MLKQPDHSAGIAKLKRRTPPKCGNRPWDCYQFYHKFQEQGNIHAPLEHKVVYHFMVCLGSNRNEHNVGNRGNGPLPYMRIQMRKSSINGGFSGAMFDAPIKISDSTLPSVPLKTTGPSLVPRRFSMEKQLNKEHLVLCWLNAPIVDGHGYSML